MVSSAPAVGPPGAAPCEVGVGPHWRLGQVKGQVAGALGDMARGPSLIFILLRHEMLGQHSCSQQSQSRKGRAIGQVITTGKTLEPQRAQLSRPQRLGALAKPGCSVAFSRQLLLGPASSALTSLMVL